jgi:hypothetical protein
MAIGIGIGIPFGRRKSGAAIDAQAQAHFDRVIADGGLVPSGLSGVNAFFIAVKAIYGTSDITTAISVGLDAQVLGYKLGAGAGTTLGQAAQKLYSCSGASGDVVQTTAASQPLLLVHEGANYWFGPTVIGNNITTPLKITSGYNGEFEIQVKIQPKNLTASQDYSIIFSAGGDGSLAIYLNGNTTNRTLGIFRNGNGIGLTTATIDVSTFNGWIKAYRTETNIRYETSTDGTTWTLFENVTITNASFTLTGNSMIGNYSSSDGRGQFTGYIYRVKVWIDGSSSTGTLTYDFNPNQYNAATSQTQWTSSTGEVWSIQTGTAKTGFKGVLVDRTIVQSNGIATSLTAASINVISEAFTLYNSFKKFNNTEGTETIFELGSGATSSQGINLLVNGFAGFESSNIFANVGRYNNNFSNNSLLLGLRANIFNINNTNEAKPYLFNNVVIEETGSSAANNNTAAVNATAINLLATNSGVTNFSQINFNTTILSLSENNTTILTAMYNYIRSINNSAF